MPDLGREFERNVEIALPSLSTPRGGISRYNNYTKLTVNFRPKNWPNENFWIGQIADEVDAKFIKDACLHYLGQPPANFPNTTFTYPALECPGTTTPLTSLEMCLNYATSIARGEENRPLRKEYREAVRTLVTELVKTDAVQTVLQQFRNAPPVVATENAHVPGGESIAHVPSFDLSESSLQSHLTPVEDDRRFEDSCLLGFEYSGADEEESCSSMRVLEEEDSAFKNFEANFFAMEDASEVDTICYSSLNFWTNFCATRDASEY